MYQKLSLNQLLFAFLLLTLAFALVSSSSAIAGDDKKYFTKEEVISHVSDKTEEWSKGAGYYGLGGELKAVWDGEKLEGTWRVKDNGEMCVNIAAWGEEGCHNYRLKNDVIELVYQGEGKFRKVESGNTLESYL